MYHYIKIINAHVHTRVTWYTVIMTCPPVAFSLFVGSTDCDPQLLGLKNSTILIAAGSLAIFSWRGDSQTNTAQAEIVSKAGSLCIAGTVSWASGPCHGYD